MRPRLGRQRTPLPGAGAILTRSTAHLIRSPTILIPSMAPFIRSPAPFGRSTIALFCVKVVFRQAAALLCALAGAMLLAACGGGAPGASCKTVDDCDDGLACFEEICHALGQPAGRIAWRIDPPAATGLVPAAFSSGRAPLQLALCKPASISASLAFPGPTRLVAHGELASLPGQVERHEQLVDDKFTMILPPGAWSLTFYPPGDEPPVRRDVQLARCESGRQLAPIQLASQTRIASLRLVIDAARDPRQRCGAFVRIHDPDTGGALSARLELRSGTDGCGDEIELEHLKFEVPTGDRIEVRIGALESSHPSLPEQRLLFALDEGGGPVDLGTLSANPGGTSLQRVWMRLSDGDGQPVKGANVIADSTLLHATEDAPDAVLRFRSAPAMPVDEDGLYELWLLPGRYAFRAEPPLEGSASFGTCVSAGTTTSCSGEATIAPGLRNELSITLPAKLTLSGVISLPSRLPAAAASIRATPAREGGGRPASAVADGAGRYELRLDPGDYDLVVHTSDRAIPWLVQPLAAPLIADGKLDVALPAPALVIGTLRGDVAGTTATVAGAMVRAYRLEPGARPALVGEAITGWDGSFGLVLPNR